MIHSRRLLKTFVNIFSFILITSLLTACGDLPSDESMKKAFDWGGVFAFFVGAMLFLNIYDAGSGKR